MAVSQKDLCHDERRTVPGWSPTNTLWLALLLMMLPVQFALLRFGEAHGLTDRIGVVLTVLQCLLLGRIFRPALGRHPASSAIVV